MKQIMYQPKSNTSVSNEKKSNIRLTRYNSAFIGRPPRPVLFLVWVVRTVRLLVSYDRIGSKNGERSVMWLIKNEHQRAIFKFHGHSMILIDIYLSYDNRYINFHYSEQLSRQNCTKCSRHHFS